MKRLAQLIFCVLVTLATATAGNKLRDLPSGRNWEGFSDFAKLSYLVGIRDGMYIAQDVSWWASGFTVEDYTKELDALYAEKENVKIPILLAFSYATVKLQGNLTRTELEAFLARIRREFSAPQ